MWTEQTRTILRRHWPWVLYTILLLAILGYAAKIRFGIPQTPLVDEDSWGYLRPGFSKLTGGDFTHAFGRNFLYPTFVFIVLCLAGNYEALPVVQHLFGLLTGVVMALSWNVLCELLSVRSARTRMAARLMGLLLVAEYLFTRWPTLFEHTLRPEAVFPLAAATSLLLNFIALHAGYIGQRPTVERWCLGLNFLVVGAAQALKPSFGLAFAAANLPMAVWLCRRGVPWRAKAWTTGAAVAAVVLTLWLPEHLLARKDTKSLAVLPTMLFSVHACYIHEQIVDDLRRGDTAPYPAPWLATFNQGLERSLAGAAQLANSPWQSLGFNADYLLTRDPVFQSTFGRRHEREIAAFCNHYYWKTWRHHPREMFGKIVRELGQAYRFRPDLLQPGYFFNVTDKYTGQAQRPLAHDYRSALTSMLTSNLDAKFDQSLYGRHFLRRLRSLGRTHAVVRQPPWVGVMNNLLDLLNLPLTGLAALGSLALVCSMRRATPVAVSAVGLIFAVNFAMFLTVATAHTLDFDRYIENQRLLTVSSEFAAVLLIWQCATRFTETRWPANLTAGHGMITPPPASPRLP